MLLEVIAVASGGARAISGPAKKVDVAVTVLPRSGYQGELPVFPLPPAVVVYSYRDDGQLVTEVDQGASEARREREAVLWEWAWSTPQAWVWAQEPWRWHAVAMWVRTAALCESAEATAADKNSLHRFAEDIGLSVAGLARNGWALAPSNLVQIPSADGVGRESAARSARERIKVVEGAG